MARCLAAIMLLWALMAPPAAAAPVVAGDYDAYWLWAGVRARPILQQAKTIYLLQGEIGSDASGVVRVKAQGGSQPAPHKPALWLAYRVRTLDWSPEILAAVIRKFEAWRGQPGRILGIQVDFDASTRDLKGYAAFLRKLRQALPSNCALSVTGLMDWASQASPEDLDALSGTIDEIIFQTYRGRQTVPDIDAYLVRLGRLRIPYRLGLAEGAQWQSPESLKANPYFQGYVIFLQNPR
jgi:Protein of unknown function (DUF3142)